MVKTEVMRYEAIADKKFDLDKLNVTKLETMDRTVYVGSGGIVYALYKHFQLLDEECKTPTPALEESKKLAEHHLMLALAEFYERFAELEMK